MKKIMIDLAGGCGAWSKDYKEAGYTVINVTLPDYDIFKTTFEDGYMDLRGNKKLSVRVGNIYGILAAPVCTHFSFARTRAKTPRDFEEGMKLVRACLNIIWECRYKTKLAFWCLENPMGYLRQFLGKPVFTFDPCDFAGYLENPETDLYTKKTDLWGYFNIPKKKPIKLNKDRIKRSKMNSRKLPSISEITSSKQSAKRAITPAGFAEAFFKANR